MKEQFIYAKAVDRKELMKKYQVGAVTISEALRFRFGSVLQRSIRNYAVNFRRCPLVSLNK